MTITLTLNVTIEGFSEEASAKGNFAARGMTSELKAIKGCEAEQLQIIATQFGNGGSLLFLTKDKGLVAKMNKAAKAAKAKPTAKPMTAEDALAMVLADPAALAKLAAAMAKK